MALNGEEWVSVELNLSSFSQLERVFDINAQVSHSAVDFDVTEQDLEPRAGFPSPVPAG